MAEERPQSNTPNFNELELKVLEFWKENKTFEKSLEQTKDGEPFIFYDGPPFATGTPHYGHILGSTVKDAFGRYQTMKGRYVRRVWGWDCHGLPIENIVEQKLGISGKKQIEDIGIEKFNETCRENVMTYVNEWGKMVERMGRWVDFDNSYKTMDTSYMESVWWGVSQVWNKGLVYEDNKVLMYCSRCETPLSTFEVAMDNSYKDVTEDSVFVKFKITPKQRLGDVIADENTYALAWTTTPWTLPGNTALNVGPDITYVIVEQDGNNYILAKDRLEVLEGEYEIKNEVSARSLEGVTYEPLYPGVIDNPDGTAFKIYPEEYVTTEDGTGIVHNAAMYGEVDYEAAKVRNLPRQQMLDHRGEFTGKAPASLAGKFFKEADPLVLAELKEKGLVFRVQSFTHSYPHCWRCGTPLYYSALPAWFINVQKVKAKMLELNENINWFPDHLKHGRFQKGIESAPDWNISRNRYWATPLPFWKCDTEFCDNAVCISSIEELKEKSANFAEVYPNYEVGNANSIDLHKPYIDKVQLPCEKCAGTMTRVPEVIDCWVESGSMPFAELHSPFENQELFQARFPADFISEYIPQTRAWFYVMHVLSTILFEKEAFRNVATTGTILAEDGSKMSKSKSNFPDPYELIERYGVDAIRYYLLTSSVIGGEDLNFSEKGVSEVNRKLSVILSNVLSFFRMYEKGKVSGAVPNVEHALDIWILNYLNQTHARVTKHLDSYNTVKAGREIQDFITELSTWYVRRSRDRIKEGGESGQQALNTLGYVLAETTKLMAPFMPFVAEHMFQELTGKESVHLEKWSEEHPVDETVLTDMQQARELVELGLSLRKEQNLKVRQPLAELLYILPEEKSLSDNLRAIVAEEINVKSVTATGEILNRPHLVAKETPGIKIALNTELTPELKKEGLAREIERQIQDLRKKSGLQIGELVDVYYNTQDTELADILNSMIDRKKTFVSQVKTSLEVEADFEAQATVDGKPIWLGLIKI